MPDPGSDAIDFIITSRSRKNEAHIRSLAKVLGRWEKFEKQSPRELEDLHLSEWMVMGKDAAPYRRLPARRDAREVLHRLRRLRRGLG